MSFCLFCGGDGPSRDLRAMLDIGSSDVSGHRVHGTGGFGQSPCSPRLRASRRGVTGWLGHPLATVVSLCDKRVQRRLILGILYVLVGVSLISTISFLSAVRSSVNREVRDHSSFSSCKSKDICPELEIPGLIWMKALDLQDISMNLTGYKVLGRHQRPVQRAVDTGQLMLRGLVERVRRTNASVQIPIMDSLSPLAIRVGDYVYLPGGHWKPTSCLPRWKVAVIFPYRDRPYHLPIVLRYLTPMLQRQLLEFAFYTVNQGNDLKFNRAMLMNVGFVEALNFSKWDCFIFHDVDHVPLSDFNYYGCSGMPRHFLSGSNRWKYRLPYDNFFGAVTGFTTGNMRQINGFPNVYWGWGGEDDEIWQRVKDVGLPISRAQGRSGYYDVINHHHNSAPQFKQRMQLLKSFKTRLHLDGLTNLRYSWPRYELHPLYTNISVNIQKVRIVVPESLPRSIPNAQDEELAKKSKIMDRERRIAVAKAALAKGHVRTRSRAQSVVKKSQSFSREDAGFG